MFHFKLPPLIMWNNAMGGCLLGLLCTWAAAPVVNRSIKALHKAICKNSSKQSIVNIYAIAFGARYCQPWQGSRIVPDLITKQDLLADSTLSVDSGRPEQIFKKVLFDGNGFESLKRNDRIMHKHVFLSFFNLVLNCSCIFRDCSAMSVIGKKTEKFYEN